jgi:hypothetical protein
MPRRDRSDDEPGVPPQTRRIAGGAVSLIMSITPDHTMFVRAQLALRWEPDGQIFAAIVGSPSDPQRS